MRMALSTQASSRDAFAMGMGFKSGLMVPSTKVTGKIIKLMDRVLSTTWMAISSKASGSTIRPMDSEPIRTQMDLGMKVLGSMICRKELAKKPGRMAPDMKEYTVRARNTAKEFMCGVTAVSTRATGMVIKYKAMGRTSGLMVVCSLENGLKTRCMGRAPTPGLMDAATKECTKMISNMAKVSTAGLTGPSTRASGP